ncbi:ribonuclease P/MRP protein subunit POP6 CYBJADRAFT_175446 [Cyberlindnera jadinii NRRL Y-1542]|uniref:DNA/RNA-binding protein Alba-like domain-containing protein n=1 Tax=Cyberlindnera jadinii (strain ATCC 18201 / CBS 1600 / BCRC 20928 / JCM 3617 / NBRC 0987 / NRRL Y-1542) TaxID=983966 RepID=A0A1E4RV06_CYBJN|nr:hypothetical protein CYBJADRAFT_175446 [Cyberlindnera jadinii NRRL Y-1542]ODV71041.1 hypothetical protein CYBJADRAFT_175446 [Cyberlindnera jadinii NRRL Y-1542]
MGVHSLPVSSDQPPQKKRRLASEDTSIPSVFTLSSSLEASKNHYRSIIVKKGDKVSRRIDTLLKLIADHGAVLVMAQGNGIQKMLTIVEIVKSKLEGENKYEQFNRLDKYDTVVKKNEVIDVKRSTAVFYTLLKKVDQLDEELKEWTRQTI